jgi:hypothetical protein
LLGDFAQPLRPWLRCALRHALIGLRTTQILSQDRKTLVNILGGGATIGPGFDPFVRSAQYSK